MSLWGLGIGHNQEQGENETQVDIHDIAFLITCKFADNTQILIINVLNLLINEMENNDYFKPKNTVFREDSSTGRFHQKATLKKWICLVSKI